MLLISVKCDHYIVSSIREDGLSSLSKLSAAACTRFPGSNEGGKGTFSFTDIWIVLHDSEQFCLSISSWLIKMPNVSRI